MIDLRSDTVTKPTKGMLQAMHDAPVGDDVFNEDPTVQKLEQKTAELFGMEAGIFCPSGTMTNQVAIKAHTQPLQEIICHRLSHIYNYEGGGIAFNSQLSMRVLESKRGFISAEEVLQNINEDDIHKPITSLVSQENTCNKAGGLVHQLADYKQVRLACAENGLKHHLDGARIFNALTVTDDNSEEYSSAFDSISICLSKGLGAPIGSVLVGDKEFIRLARRIRKVLGGGMRQVGLIAAAGIYALDNHVDRLQQDHEHARILSECLKGQAYIRELYPVETNIVIFKLADDVDEQGFLSYLTNNGIGAITMAPKTIRFVTHLDISGEDIKKLTGVLNAY